MNEYVYAKPMKPRGLRLFAARKWPGFPILVLALCACLRCATGAEAPGLLAEWRFDEGEGDVAVDSSGHGHNLELSGPVRTRLGEGFVLALDGLDDYAEGPNSSELGIGGPLTLEAWLKPTRKAHGEAVVLGEGFSSYVLTYYNTEIACFYIGDGSNNVVGKLALGEWNHVAASFDGQKLYMWVNGRLTGSRESKFKTYQPGGRFMIATKGRPDLPKFKGFIDNVRVYARAFSGEEAGARFKSEAPAHGLDPSWFTRVRVTPFLYEDRGELVIEADYRGLQPLDGPARLEATLSSAKRPRKAIERVTVDPLPDGGMVEAKLPLRKLADGEYVVRVVLHDGKGARPPEEIRFSLPARSDPLPSPAERSVGPLPEPKPSTPFLLHPSAGGGFAVEIAGVRYPFETRISWPNGDFNRLVVADIPCDTGEQNWTVTLTPEDRNRFIVRARGAFYAVERVIEARSTHIRISDTYTNLTNADLGLLIYNDTSVEPKKITGSWLSGYERQGRQAELSYPDYAPSAFFTDETCGLGIVPLDDVYIVQAVPYVNWNGAAGLADERFALPPGGSHTLEWAVYPTPSRDYYDFVNAFREAEGRIGTVKETAGFITFGPFNRRQVPDEDFVKTRGITVGIVHCLSGAADDPEVSIEGIEFMDFPEEMRLLREQAAAIHARLPGFKVVFHIAHSLYCTNRPDRFADSKVILADGRQAIWGASEPYISKRRQEEGWTWWIYYPTPGNSFHDALMRSVDVIMGDLGFDGVFMDGFLAGYCGKWSYDTDLRWDEHSAEIDPTTKTIRRRMNSVILMSQPSMIEFARRIRDRGGVVISNNAVLTRSLASEKYIIFDNECASGPEVHLAPSVTALAAPPFSNQKEMYLDVLDKLSWGELFIHYGERIRLDYPSLAAKQFPITFEEIRPGLVRGRERIVTSNPGVYGWPGDWRLHLVHKFDARGAPVPNDFVTTVDASGVRTEVALDRHQSAVIEPVPATLEVEGPVNARIVAYDGTGIHLALNGQGSATLRLFVGTRYPDKREGVFTGGGINPAQIGVGAPYSVNVGGKVQQIEERDGTLTVPVQLAGRTELLVRPLGESEARKPGR